MANGYKIGGRTRWLGYYTTDSADLKSVPSKGLKEIQNTTTKSSSL